MRFSSALADPAAAESRALAYVQDPERNATLALTGLLTAGIDDALQRYAQLAADLIEAPISFVSVVAAEHQCLGAAVGLTPGEATLDLSVCKHVVADDMALAVSDLRADAVLSRNRASTELGIRAYLGAPVGVDGKRLGAFGVADRAVREWTERDCRIVADLAAAVDAEIALRLRAAEQERLALTDALTGLGNRRALALAVERALASGESWWLALLDLDGFKAYNDTFGHPAGDALLVRLARRLRTSVAGGGEAFRMGGDEFCVLVRDAPLMLAAQAALNDQGPAYRVSASRGSVEIPHEANTSTAIVGLADRRLYGAKRSRPGSLVQQIAATLSMALAERDHELDDRADHVSRLARDIALELGMDKEAARHVAIAARLHDIGKMAISDKVLEKPGPLDRTEWEQIERHTIIGERILAAAPALAEAAALVRSSHEFFDGTGYPDGLCGDQIPLGARIIAACDAYEAMIHERPYRAARAQQGARHELLRCAGEQFDPHVVEALLGTLAPEPNPPSPPAEPPPGDPAEVARAAVGGG